jgi:hypothetical protein
VGYKPSRRAQLASHSTCPLAKGVHRIDGGGGGRRDGRRPAADRRAGAKPSNPTPKPTTSTVTVGGTDFHFTFFGPGIDPSSITDFNGFVGVADVQGTGTATNPDGSTETLLFDTDMRLMSGVYVGQDGAVHKGTFGFV